MERSAAQQQPAGRRAVGRRTAPVECSATETAVAPGTGPDPARLVLRVRADIDQLRKVRRRVERWLRTHGVTEDTLIDVHLALGEAVSTSMEHAYRDAEPGGVDIDMEVRAGVAGRAVVARVTSSRTGSEVGFTVRLDAG